jgi:alpha-amylase/alpha-mannosidase (GH57 family)
MERIMGIKLHNSHKEELISTAVDGETFGHHKPFTERTIAYLMDELAPKNNYKVTNFGEYLSDHPQHHEVRIKKGRNGEGTSWSCAHGVGRWRENCGCGQGEPGWNQKWRMPLRESLDWLRDELIKLTEEEGRKYLKDVWHARNDYIKVILQPGRESFEKFFYFNAKNFLTDEESMTCMKIMEIQKNAMYMYTSCGWFFSDVSGLETLIILRYAAKAIELAKEISGNDLEEEFLQQLSGAKSNLPQYRDGRYIYETKIKNKKK